MTSTSIPIAGAGSRRCEGYGSEQDAIYLVRPDGHVHWRPGGNAGDVLKSYVSDTGVRFA